MLMISLSSNAISLTIPSNRSVNLMAPAHPCPTTHINPLNLLSVRCQQKVRARYAAFTPQSATLEDLVKNEKFENKGKVGTAGEGLMWLLR